MSKVQTLPPTDAIKDPEVRAFCDALANAWNLRNGNITAGEEERFVTKGEIESASLNALAKALAGSFAPGGPASTTGDVPGGLTAPVPNAAAVLLDELLRQRIQMLTIPAIADVRKKVENSEAGMLAQKNTYVSRDFALASAVNTMWAVVGGSEAIIQDGALAAAVPNGATATNWNQVQAAIDDPLNPGSYVNTAAVREESRIVSTNIRNDLQASWTVRVNANNVITGIGLGITSGPQGLVSSFNVMADQFWLYSPNYTIATAPFRVDTNTGTTYLNAAMIGTGQITNAMIENQIYSTEYFPSGGLNGWLIDKNGSAYFQNVVIEGNSVIRGTATVGRLNVQGAVTGSIRVFNNQTSAVGFHGAGRIPVITIWSPDGAATLSNVDETMFTVRLDFSSGGTVYFSCF